MQSSTKTTPLVTVSEKHMKLLLVALQQDLGITNVYRAERIASILITKLESQEELRLCCFDEAYLTEKVASLGTDVLKMDESETVAASEKGKRYEPGQLLKVRTLDLENIVPTCHARTDAPHPPAHPQMYDPSRTVESHSVGRVAEAVLSPTGRRGPKSPSNNNATSEGSSIPSGSGVSTPDKRVPGQATSEGSPTGASGTNGESKGKDKDVELSAANLARFSLSGIMSLAKGPDPPRLLRSRDPHLVEQTEAFLDSIKDLRTSQQYVIADQDSVFQMVTSHERSWSTLMSAGSD